RGLSPERKKVIREMGFRDLIEFPIFEIPTKLAFYVVDILNTTNMTLECPMGDIEITPKTVKQVLGLPMGRRRLEREGQREYNDPFLLQWKDQFRNVNKLTIKALSDNVFEGDDVSDIDWCSYIIECASVSKLDWATKLKKKDVVYYGPVMFLMELYEMLEENINNILIEKSEIEEKINESLIKFQDDEKLLQLKQRMKDIFKEPDMPEYLSSSSSESDDDNDDGSQLADENEESYRKETHSNDEDDVEIIAEVQKDERNETHYTAECSEKKDEQETGTSKKDEADNNKEEGMANKKATNQKINEEIDPFDDPKFGEYYIQNEHLFVPTQTSAEKKKDQTDDVNWDSFLENEEEIIRKGREFSAEIRKKAQQQEREQKRKGKKEKDQIGSSSQESPVFGIDNSLQGSQPTFDLGASPTYEKMKILSEKKKKMGLKSKYVNKTVDPAVELTEDEKLLGRSIFSTQEEEEEEVFNDNEGLILFRMNIQSLAPGLEIDTSVIDVLFPIIAHGHYYLIVFNLKTGKAVIIDNNESDATYEGKYKDNVEFVRSVFGKHLLMYQNTNADKILTAAKKSTILKMKWKTKEEKIDCGLYMIMHMELYEGSTPSQWKIGLLPENDNNHRMQMDNLRSRIATKILLHEVNIYQKKMSDYAKKITKVGEGGSNRE
ncbi:peptidase C48, SUMO/sentrin/Ubl1, partial [Tanacetum coccineum]